MAAWVIDDEHVVQVGGKKCIHLRELIDPKSEAYSNHVINFRTGLRIVHMVGTDNISDALSKGTEHSVSDNDRERWQKDLADLHIQAEREDEAYSRRPPISSAIVDLHRLAKGSLAVPHYQRAYVWTEEHITALMNDLVDAFKNYRTSNYLLGTLILHRRVDRFEIVDGQQRIISLSLLLKALGDEAGMPLRNVPKHERTKNNVGLNYSYIEALLSDVFGTDRSSFLTFVQRQIKFLAIAVRSLDDAFIFFDSQNTRGKPLERHELLKAHHLRYIPDDQIAVASACSKIWESIDEERGRLDRLLLTYLGSARMFARNEFGSVDVLEEFRSQLPENSSVGQSTSGWYALNRYEQPPLFTGWRYDWNTESPTASLKVREATAWPSPSEEGILTMHGNASEIIPLQLTQTLLGGEQMFCYVAKYDQLKRKLDGICSVKQNKSDPSYQELQTICSVLDRFEGGIEFLKDGFEAALLFFLDKYGQEELNTAALYFEHYFFMPRLMNASVRKTTLRALFKEWKTKHPFYLIDRSASPAHVFDVLRRHMEFQWATISAKVKETVAENGQPKKYFKAMYSMEDAPFGTNRREHWINRASDYAVSQAIWQLKQRVYDDIEATLS